MFHDVPSPARMSILACEVPSSTFLRLRFGAAALAVGGCDGPAPLPQNERSDRAVDVDGAVLSCVEVEVDAIDASSMGGDGIEAIYAGCEVCIGQ